MYQRLSTWQGPWSIGHHVQHVAAHLANLHPSSPQDFAGYLEFLCFILPDRPCRPQRSSSCCYVILRHISVCRSPKILDFPSKQRQAIAVSVQTWPHHKKGLRSEGWRMQCQKRVNSLPNKIVKGDWDATYLRVGRGGRQLLVCETVGQFCPPKHWC